MASRIYLAGMLENTPSNIRKWIQQPRAVNPKTASAQPERDCSNTRDIAAYLYTMI
jgi:cytochrome c